MSAKNLSNFKITKSYQNLLLLFGLLVIFIAVPFTVYLSLTTKELAPKSSAATVFEQTACATSLDPKGNSQCGASIGNPNDYYFCDRWTGGWCRDYRAKQTTTEMPFPQPEDETSLDCLSSTNVNQNGTPYYIPTMGTLLGGPPAEVIPFPCGFTKLEHFMTRIEDGQFGMLVMRQQRPVDFTGRTAHIHVDIDLKTASRRYVRFMLSPELSKVIVDDRNGLSRPNNAIDIWDINGTVQINQYKNGAHTEICSEYPGCGGSRYYGADNVRDHVDLYVSRTNVKMTINGNLIMDKAVPDFGFDKAYLYLDQASYNPCKAFETQLGGANGFPGTIAECQLALNMNHWDNVAVDGPKMAVNALTPVGMQDVVFNVYSATSCNVKGVNAQLSGVTNGQEFETWVARMPIQSVTAADVSCVANYRNQGPQGFEVVQAGASTVNPPPPPPVAVNPPPPPPVAVNPPPPPSTGGQVISITSPINGATVSGTLTIGAQTINSSGVTQVNFLIDGVSIGTDTTSPFFIDWNTAAKTNGTHTITVRPMNITGPDAIATVTVNNAVSSAKVGDVNGDNLVNGSDLAAILSKWGTSDLAADLSKNGKVDSSDLAILLAHWGS